MSQQINTNVYNFEYRKNFMRNADVNSLNEYLKYMEKLSKKGDKYLTLYNEDIDFLVNSSSQSGGNILDILLGQKTAKSNIDPVASEVCNTEGIFNKLNNITGNSFCSLTTQQTKKCDNRCESRLDEVNLIRNVLNKENTHPNSTMDWISAIRKFSDIVLCCGNVFSKNEYELFRTVYFKDILKIISHNPKFTREAFNYLGKILRNEKNKLSDEFMKRYSELRSIKNKFTPQQYKNEKANLINYYISKYGDKGFETIYSSKMVEKIIHSFKMNNAK